MTLGYVHQGEQFDIHWGKKLLLTYHFSNHEPKSYFHPVNLFNGSTLTINSPYDHTWHHGLFFTWKYINGKNFWEENLPDGEMLRDVTYVVVFLSIVFTSVLSFLLERTALVRLYLLPFRGFGRSTPPA